MEKVIEYSNKDCCEGKDCSNDPNCCKKQRSTQQYVGYLEENSSGSNDRYTEKLVDAVMPS